MSAADVLITGAGLVSSLGRGLEPNLAGVKAMETGLRSYPEDGVPASLCVRGEAGETDPFEGLDPALLPHAKFLNRGARFGLLAAREAVGASGIQMERLPPERKSAYIGAGDLTKTDFTDFHAAMREATRGEWAQIDAARLNQASLGAVTPFMLLESLNNNLFSFLTAVFDIRGSSTSLAGLSPTGAQAVGLAFRAVAEGRADAALAVGYSAWVNAVALYELHGLRLLSAARDGARSFRPMDRRRDGFLAGEGGAAVLLESAEHAAARGAEPLGRLTGYADAQERAKDGSFGIPLEAASRAARTALEEAGVAPADLALVCPHGSGTRKGDRAEMAAILDILGQHAPRTPVTCMKPYTGHMAAASDIADLVLCLLCLREGCVPAALNYERSEHEFAALSIAPDSRSAEGRDLLSLSYGLGGQVAAIMASVA